MVIAGWARMISRGDGLPLFRVGGIPVSLALSWWLGAVVITVLYTPLVRRLLPTADLVSSVALAAGFALLLGVSVLAHELGHCLTALRLGLPVHRLRIFLLGGISEMSAEPKRPRQEGLIAAAGPAVSIVLAGLFGLIAVTVPFGGPLWLLMVETAIANAAVALFNLLPGLPLDGGRLIRALVWALTGRRGAGTKVAVIGAGLVAVVLLLWALSQMAQSSSDRWLWLGVCVLTAWFVIAGARGELLAEQRRSWPEGIELADVARPIAQLSVASPITQAVELAQEQGVLLVHADGTVAGLLDVVADRRLAAEHPLSPAGWFAEPVSPDNVLLHTDSPADIAERVRASSALQFLIVDADGKPAAVLRRADLLSAQGRFHGR